VNSEVELLWKDADMAVFLSWHEGTKKNYENHATNLGLNL
jgi:hypothetical protein